MDILSLIWNLNISLFYFINLNLETPILNFLMPLITLFGSLYLWIIVFSMLFVFGGIKGKNTAILGFIILLLSTSIVIILKSTIAEPRPFIALENVNLLQSVSSYSFPSGHTATAFAGVLLIGKKYGHIHLLMMLACLIGFSRAYVGVHYPIDIIFGAMVGIICALIVLKYENAIFSNKFIQAYHIKEHS